MEGPGRDVQDLFFRHILFWQQEKLYRQELFIENIANFAQKIKSIVCLKWIGYKVCYLMTHR